MVSIEYEELKKNYRKLCEVANKELSLILNQVYDDMENARIESLDNFDLLILNLNVSSLSHILENVVEYRKKLMNYEEKRISYDESGDQT